MYEHCRLRRKIKRIKKRTFYLDDFIMSAPQPPKTMKAFIQESKDAPFTIKEVPTPEPGPGTAVVKILYNLLQTQTQDILAGKTGFR